MASQEVVCRLRTVRNKMARWLPNFEDFLLSLGRLIENSEEQMNSASYDTSELSFRPLKEYERTLSTLVAHVCEVYGQVDSQQTCMAQLNHVLSRTTLLRAHFQQLCSSIGMKKMRMKGKVGFFILNNLIRKGVSVSNIYIGNNWMHFTEIVNSAGTILPGF